MAGTIDSSLLYAVLDSDDAHHEQARSRLADHRGLEVTPAVLAETEMLIRKRSGRRTALESLGGFLSANPHVGIMDADLHPEAQRIWKKHAGISYTDAHAIAAALHLGDDLLTFDARQEAAWREERGRTSPG